MRRLAIIALLATLTISAEARLRGARQPRPIAPGEAFALAPTVEIPADDRRISAFQSADDGSTLVLSEREARPAATALYATLVGSDGEVLRELAVAAPVELAAWSPAAEAKRTADGWIIAWTEVTSGLRTALLRDDGALVQHGVVAAATGNDQRPFIASVGSGYMTVAGAADGKRTAVVLDADGAFVSTSTPINGTVLDILGGADGAWLLVLDPCAGASCNAQLRLIRVTPAGVLEQNRATGVMHPASEAQWNARLVPLPDGVMLVRAHYPSGPTLLESRRVYPSTGLPATMFLATPLSRRIWINEARDRVVVTNFNEIAEVDVSAAGMSLPRAVGVLDAAADGDRFTIAAGAGSTIAVHGPAAATLPDEWRRTVLTRGSHQTDLSIASMHATSLAVWSAEAESGAGRIVMRLLRSTPDGRPVPGPIIELGDGDRPQAVVAGEQYAVAWRVPGAFEIAWVSEDGWVVAQARVEDVASGAAPAIGWDGHALLVAWSDASAIRAVRVRIGGVFEGAPLVIHDSPAHDGRVHVASSPARVALAWEHYAGTCGEGCTLTSVLAATVDYAGNVTAPVSVSASDLPQRKPVMARIGDDWAAAWQEAGTVRVRRLSSSGLPLGEVIAPAISGAPVLAASAEELLLIADAPTLPFVSVSTGSMTVLRSGTLLTTPHHVMPALTWTGGHTWLLGWSQPSWLSADDGALRAHVMPLTTSD